MLSECLTAPVVGAVDFPYGGNAVRVDGLRPRALADRVAGLAGEGALDVLVRARALEAAGRRVIHLEVGEPDHAPPAAAVAAATRALAAGDARYGPPMGLAELRDAVAQSFADRDVRASAEDVVVTPGAKPALLYAFLALVQPGDEVLVPDPGFPIYASLVRLTGGVPVRYPVSGPLEAEAIAERLTERTRLLVLNLPGNPTGTVASAATLAAVAALVERHDLWVLSDEIYARLSFDLDDAQTSTKPFAAAPSLAALGGMRERTVIVDGFSKAYAMTGWRLGYAVLPRAVAPAVGTLAINGHSCVPAFVQRAGLAALEGSQDVVANYRATLRARRDALVDALGAIPGVQCARPGGAFYAFPDLRGALAPDETSAAFAERLLVDHGLAALAGTAFGPGGEGHLRLSFAAPATQLSAAVAALRACLDRSAHDASLARPDVHVQSS